MLVLVSGERRTGAWNDIYENPKVIYRGRTNGGGHCWGCFRKEDAPDGYRQVELPTDPEKFFDQGNFAAPTNYA